MTMQGNVSRPKETVSAGQGRRRDKDLLADMILGHLQEIEKLAERDARMRRSIELRWRRNLEQYYSIYPPDVRKKLSESKGSSRAFYNLTRPRTRTMNARLSDILLPTDTPNWKAKATAVPELASQQDMNPGEETSAEETKEQKVVKAAKKMAEAMSKVMTDQLQECDFTNITRKAISQACKYGTGVVKGPYAGRAVYTWKQSAEGWSYEVSIDKTPAFTHVDLWNFLPDMNAMSMMDAEHVHELHRMNRRQVQRLGREDGFNKSQITNLLREKAKLPSFHECIRDLRESSNSADETFTDDRYYVWEYHGPLPVEWLEQVSRIFGKTKIAKAIEKMKEAEEVSVIDGVVWYCQGKLLKFGINQLDSGELPYSVFRIDPDELGIFGQGIPALMEHGQGSLNAAWRMIMENGGMAGVPMIIIDRKQIEPDDGSDDYSFGPKKVWRRKTSITKDGAPAIEVVGIDINTEALERIVSMIQHQINEETSLPLISQGEQSAKMTQTAHGMSLLTNAANVIFKNAARSFDNELLVPCLTRLYHWNMQFHPDDKIKGDVRILALGSSVLLLRELQGQNLLMVIQMAGSNEMFQQIVKMPEMFRKLMNTLQIPKDDVIASDNEFKKLQEALQSQPSPEEIKGQIEMQKLEVSREIAQLQFRTEILRQAGQEKTTTAKLAADLEKTRLSLGSKERLSAAEIAVKERHGTGW